MEPKLVLKRCGSKWEFQLVDHNYWPDWTKVISEGTFWPFWQERDFQGLIRLKFRTRSNEFHPQVDCLSTEAIGWLTENVKRQKDYSKSF